MGEGDLAHGADRAQAPHQDGLDRFGLSGILGGFESLEGGLAGMGPLGASRERFMPIVTQMM